MLNYPDTLTVIGLDGEQFELNQCRISQSKIIFTKDTDRKVQSGSKIIKNCSDGSKKYFFVKSVASKPNLLGSLEIYVTPL